MLPVVVGLTRSCVQSRYSSCPLHTPSLFPSSSSSHPHRCIALRSILITPGTLVTPSHTSYSLFCLFHPPSVLIKSDLLRPCPWSLFDLYTHTTHTTHTTQFPTSSCSTTLQSTTRDAIRGSGMIVSFLNCVLRRLLVSL